MNPLVEGTSSKGKKSETFLGSRLSLGHVKYKCIRCCVCCWFWTNLHDLEYIGIWGKRIHTDRLHSLSLSLHNIIWKFLKWRKECKKRSLHCCGQCLVVDQLSDAGQAAVLVGNVEWFEHVREWCVPTGHSQHRRFQMEEALFLDGGGQLGAESVRQWGFVGDQYATRLLNRLKPTID